MSDTRGPDVDLSAMIHGAELSAKICDVEVIHKCVHDNDSVE
jgi:hypothetical protein